MQPSVWGKHIWATIHYVALGFPDNPSNVDKHRYSLFYESIGAVLPCQKCAINFQKHFKELPLAPYLTGPKQLFAWTVEFHNIVNKSLGHREWTVEEAYPYYTRINNNAVQKDYYGVMYFVVGLNVVAIVMFLIFFLRKK